MGYRIKMHNTEWYLQAEGKTRELVLKEWRERQKFALSLLTTLTYVSCVFPVSAI